MVQGDVIPVRSSHRDTPVKQSVSHSTKSYNLLCWSSKMHSWIIREAVVAERSLLPHCSSVSLMGMCEELHSTVHSVSQTQHLRCFPKSCRTSRGACPSLTWYSMQLYLLCTSPSLSLFLILTLNDELSFRPCHHVWCWQMGKRWCALRGTTMCM